MNWITEVWEHLHTCKATVEVDGMWQPDDNRQHDIVIMEALVASGKFTNKETKEKTTAEYTYNHSLCRISQTWQFMLP
jgi:hypothetical protein